MADPDPLTEQRLMLAARDARIAQLEAEVARLRPSPPPVATIDGPFMPPDLAQTAKLIDITVSAYPKLRPRAVDHERFIRSVRHCISFIGTCNRLPPGQTDSKYRERWADRCQQWVVQQGIAADVSPLIFCIAIIASGDVDFVDPDSVGNGGVLNYGLSDGVGRRPKNGWLLVLQNNKPREPLLPALVGDWHPAVRHQPMGNEKYLPPGRYESI
jgi:hypothetical protein